MFVIFPVCAERIVFFALVGIVQDFVCLVHLFELLFGILVIRIDVGVQFARQFAIRGFDIFFVGIFGNAQNFIIIFVFHARCSSAVQKKTGEFARPLKFVLIITFAIAHVNGFIKIFNKNLIKILSSLLTN